MIILASASLRRQQLIKEITNDFIICPADIDERELSLSNEEYSKDLAKRKAYDVFNKYPDDVIIACDTIVIFNNQIFNKPKDEKEAYFMLSTLSDNKHIVLTSFTILTKDIEINNTVKSIVYFNKLDDSLINAYIKTGECFDKAGGYAIQDKNFNFVKYVEGSIDNVIGFPVKEIKQALIKFKLI